jgi:hypothetical protein
MRASANALDQTYAARTKEVNDAAKQIQEALEYVTREQSFRVDANPTINPDPLSFWTTCLALTTIDEVVGSMKTAYTAFTYKFDAPQQTGGQLF